MGKDLTGMIEEINDTSSTLNKNNKTDDPVSLSYCLMQQISVFDADPIVAFASCPSTQQPPHAIATN